MLPPGRPKGEPPRAQREASPMLPPGRPKGESPSAQREDSPVGAPADAARSGPPLADALQLAAHAWRAFRDGSSLDRALTAAGAALPGLHPRAGAAARDITYTAARRLALIDTLLARLAQRAPDAPIEALLAVALGQLLAGRQRPFVVVDQAVQACKRDPGTQPAAGFVNAMLRNALRRMEPLVAAAQADERVRHNLPGWWLRRLQQAAPDDWARVAQLQREPPPQVLRIEPRAVALADYAAHCAAIGIAARRVGRTALRIDPPCPVEELPGFAQGWFAVQDAGAQLAAEWLGVADGMRVLDACAAPGGKTLHLAGLARIELDALDVDAARAARIEDGLARLQPHLAGRVRVQIADAADRGQLRAATAGAAYDRILLDAPCTASGIVRRHPDIPWLRRPADVAKLATQQRRLLEALWPLLRPAGRLLYVVCSVFPEEGAQQVDSFLQREPQARLVVLPGAPQATRRLLPADSEAAYEDRPDSLPTVHDGFFYALIEKS